MRTCGLTLLALGCGVMACEINANGAGGAASGSVVSTTSDSAASNSGADTGANTGSADTGVNTGGADSVTETNTSPTMPTGADGMTMGDTEAPGDTDNPPDTDTDDPGDSSDSTDTGEPFDCDDGTPYGGLVMIEDAVEVQARMVLVPAWGGLSGTPEVAYSEQETAGAVIVEIDVPCERTYYLWGLIWDRYHGAPSCGGTYNPDRYWVQIDGGAEEDWRFACNTCDAPDSTWTWASIDRYLGSGCTTESVLVPLTAGPHLIRFRNEEEGDFDPPENPNVAAIAAVVISDDPDFDPSTLYSP